MLLGNFDIEDLEVHLESPTEGGQRIDVESGAVVIECKRDLQRAGVLVEAERQLTSYLAHREGQSGLRYVGIATDGSSWRLYRLADSHEAVEEVDHFDLRTVEDEQRFRWWLGTVLATEHRLTPSAGELTARLGSGSPYLRLALAELSSLWHAGETNTTIALKRSLWEKLLRTALGTQFEGDDVLFVEHTYLVLVATLIGHAVIGYDPRKYREHPAVMLTGELFAAGEIHGVGEAGFFDWVIDIDGGEAFLERLARHVGGFIWEHVDHDVLKALYESVISPDDRHRLGEYYTPDWLAEHMVFDVVDDPLNQRVLDPSCGSGTFVFHAVRRYLDAATAAGHSTAEALGELPGHVFGLDLHPVAVVLAQVTYLLAIGLDRLAARTGPLSVPVYLGDSMRWEASDTSMMARTGAVVIPTGDGQQLFDAELSFPSGVVANEAQFDRLVADLADKAAGRARGGKRTPASQILARYALSPEDRQVIESTYKVLCDLHDDGRNHIWGFYVRNQARPAWLAMAQNRVDVLVGNPPWLSYRYMPREMQERFRTGCKQRSLWAGGRVATHQDLSGYFVARSVELYLRIGGRFGFVMPRAVLSRQQFEGFRKGSFQSPGESCFLSFERPWDLGEVDPEPFPVPSCVVLGRRSDLGSRDGLGTNGNVGLPAEAVAFTGKVKSHDSWEGAAQRLQITEHSITSFDLDDVPRSPYAVRFRQGATLVPRMIATVTDAPPSPIGVPAGRRAVQSRRTTQEKQPWKSLPTMTGAVETIFVRHIYLGESVLPYRLLPPLEGVIPHDGTRLLHGGDDRIDRYPGLADWWRRAEECWDEHKANSTTLSLLGRFDYVHNLGAQFPVAPIRVVYSKAGNRLAAAKITDRRAVIDHMLYWCVVDSEDEARYLCAVLNSETLGDLVRPYQSVGAFGPRHFDKYVWYPPTPQFDAGNERHRHLVDLAIEAEQVAAGVALPDGIGFQQARKMIRLELDHLGTTEAINTEVAELLGVGTR